MSNHSGNILTRFFSPVGMIKPDKRLADDFSAKPMYSEFTKIAVPSLIESVLIGFINFADTLMVSQCGDRAVAAVGLTNQPRLLFYAVYMSLSIAMNAIVARRYGEGKREEANRTMAQILPVAVILSVLFAVVGCIVAEPLLLFAGANPEETLKESVEYFRIVMVGMIFTTVSLMINAAQRACGNTRISMTTNLSANVVNIIFNALLINGLFFFPRLEVKGAAIATLIGNAVSAVISIASVRRKGRYLFLKVRDMFRIDRSVLKNLVKIGSGASVEQIFLRIGFFMFAKIVAELGTQAFATHQICMNIINLSFTVGDGLGVASSALVGQYLGRKRPDKSMVFGKMGQRVGLCFSVVLILLFSIAGGMIVGWFTDTDIIIHDGRIILYIVACITPIQISQVVFSGCLRGAGDTKYMAVVSFISVTIVRTAMSYLLINIAGLGVFGAWIALAIDQIMRCVCAIIRFYSQKWCKVKLYESSPENPVLIK